MIKKPKILPRILVVLGPTASGKSDLAVELARKLGGEVISADSRQVYKGLDIGTGKITKKEMRGVLHHLLDVVSPRRQFGAAEYKKLAQKAINEIVARGKLPIICGGTGHYISVILGEQNIPEVPPNLGLRKKLDKKSAEELFSMLQKLDPRRAKEIDRKNPRRLIRAIEIVQEIGKVPEFKKQSEKFKVLKIGIKVPDKELERRINKRLAARIKKGMVAEAKGLYAAGVSYKRMRALGLEYGRLADLLEKKITKEEFTTLLRKEIRQYAKRQLTWFKRDKNIVWIPPKIKLAEKEVKKFLSI